MTQTADQIAFHEAGHVVVAARVKFELGPVTIEPGKSFGGCTWWTQQALDESVYGQMVNKAAGPLLPLEVQRHYDLEVLVTLAGDAAVELRRNQLGRRSARARGTTAPAPELRAVAPNPAGEEAAMVERARDVEPAPGQSDTEIAWNRAMYLNDGDIASARRYEDWMDGLVRRELGRLWHRVEAVAAELLEHRTLSGAYASEVLDR